MRVEEWVVKVCTGFRVRIKGFGSADLYFVMGSMLSCWQRDFQAAVGHERRSGKGNLLGVWVLHVLQLGCQVRRILLMRHCYDQGGVAVRSTPKATPTPKPLGIDKTLHPFEAYLNPFRVQ